MHEIRSSILASDKPLSLVARKAKAKADGSGLGSLAKVAIKRVEARVTDMRAEDRLPGLVEETIVHFRRKKHAVRVVNVSSRGAMLDFDVDARIGERIDIRFAEENRTRCIVRWVREGRIGVEFVEEAIFWDRAQPRGPVFQHATADEGDAAAEPPAPFVDRAPRQTLLRSGTLYWSGISIPVRLKNISASGARVEGGQELCPGCEVELDLGEAGFQTAEVRWSKDGQVGLRFAADFNLDALAPAAAAAPGPRPEHVKPAYLETETMPDSPWAARFERLSMTDLKVVDPS